MARKRFNKDEKEIITSGEPIEWQNVTQWHPARLINSDIITDDGWQHVTAINLETTRTISNGATIYISPGHIRLAQKDTQSCK